MPRERKRPVVTVNLNVTQDERDAYADSAADDFYSTVTPWVCRVLVEQFRHYTRAQSRKRFRDAEKSAPLPKPERVLYLELPEDLYARVMAHVGADDKTARAFIRRTCYEAAGLMAPAAR